MKRHELIDHLRRQGCELAREGTRHTIFGNPMNRAKAPVPRHSEIDNRLANRICRELGIAPVR